MANKWKAYWLKSFQHNFTQVCFILINICGLPQI